MRTNLVAYLLWFPLGVLGLHRFYCGRVISGVIWFFTGGVLGVGWLVDAFLIPDMVRQANLEERVRRQESRWEHGAIPAAAVAEGYRVIYCTQCGGPMQAPKNAAGSHFRCPACHATVVAPA